MTTPATTNPATTTPATPSDVTLDDIRAWVDTKVQEDPEQVIAEAGASQCLVARYLEDQTGVECTVIPYNTGGGYARVPSTDCTTQPLQDTVGLLACAFDRLISRAYEAWRAANPTARWPGRLPGIKAKDVVPLFQEAQDAQAELDAQKAEWDRVQAELRAKWAAELAATLGS